MVPSGWHCGAPSHDTFDRPLARVVPKGFPTIIEKKADSVIQVKENQQRRHQDPALFFRMPPMVAAALSIPLHGVTNPC
jgi:hypothetical protein